MVGRIACVGEVMLDVFVATSERHGRIRVRAGGTPFKVPGGPIIPVLAASAILWVLETNRRG